jgi:hypothetical protein
LAAQAVVQGKLNERQLLKPPRLERVAGVRVRHGVRGVGHPGAFRAQAVMIAIEVPLAFQTQHDAPWDKSKPKLKLSRTERETGESCGRALRAPKECGSAGKTTAITDHHYDESKGLQT